MTASVAPPMVFLAGTFSVTAFLAAAGLGLAVSGASDFVAAFLVAIGT